MARYDVNLSRYAVCCKVYREKIREAVDLGEVRSHAATFLDRVACLFDRDIENPFYDEVDFLWATFPTHLKTLEKYKELLEVLSGQLVDFYWYADWPQYRSAQDVISDKNLYSFKRSNADFDVRFSYVQYYSHALMRVPNSLRLRYRRLVNHPGKYTQGLTTTRCKKAIVGFVNQLSDDTARLNGVGESFKLLVNSVLRTVEYQHSLEIRRKS